VQSIQYDIFAQDRFFFIMSDQNGKIRANLEQIYEDFCIKNCEECLTSAPKHTSNKSCSQRSQCLDHHLLCSQLSSWHLICELCIIQAQSTDLACEHGFSPEPTTIQSLFKRKKMSLIEIP
jgi:hypothetical protein